MKKRRSNPRTRQRGISLLVVTVLVLAMVLMTLTAFYVSKSQYRLVGNIQSSEQAFSAAESVLANAEAWVNANSKVSAFETRDSVGNAHLYPRDGLGKGGLDLAAMTWSDSNSLSNGDGRYLIELMARNVRKPGDSLTIGQKVTACKAVDLFRVVAKADAGNSGSRMIESIQAVNGC